MRFLLTVAGHAHNAHDRYVCAGYDNGDIKLFDLRKMAVRWETNVKNGVSRNITLILFKLIILQTSQLFTIPALFDNQFMKNLIKYL